MALIEGALLFLYSWNYTHENYFKHQYKQSYRYSNNQDFDYYKAPHLLQHASNSAADVEAHEWRAIIRVDCVSRMAAYLTVYWALFSRLFSDFIVLSCYSCCHAVFNWLFSDFIVLSSKILLFMLSCGIIRGCTTI